MDIKTLEEILKAKVNNKIDESMPNKELISLANKFDYGIGMDGKFGYYITNSKFTGLKYLGTSNVSIAKKILQKLTDNIMSIQDLYVKKDFL